MKRVVKHRDAGQGKTGQAPYFRFADILHKEAVDPVDQSRLRKKHERAMAFHDDGRILRVDR
jgi:hypothetical protein